MTIKSILRNSGRQLVASLIILIIGFLAFNWSAYYQIGRSKFYDWTGREMETPLSELAEKRAVIHEREILAIGNDIDSQRRQIPELDLEIAPIDNRIIIPQINQNIPIVNVSTDSLVKRDWAALERDMQTALRDGVVYYPGTSSPGQPGNTVITGHSSYFPWDPGRFKDVFALLHRVKLKDRIVIYHNQDKYIYEVSEIKVVYPEEIDILKQTPDPQLTLITCTPVGTNLKRLVVKAKPIIKNDIELDVGPIPR